jgi:hypothetical protein
MKKSRKEKSGLQAWAVVISGGPGEEQQNKSAVIPAR